MIRKKILYVFSILLISSGLVAQSNSIKIAAVSVVGNSTASENIVKINSGLVDGATLSADDIQDGIKKLWRLRLFSDIKVFAERETEEGLYIIIKVDEYPRLASIEYSGNKKIKTKHLEEDITFIIGQVINPHVINKAVREIEDQYEEKGYYNVEIDVSTEPGEIENTIKVLVDIEEGEKVRIRQILFEGNENISDFNLRRKMKEIKQRKWYTFFNNGKFDEDLFEDDKLAVLKHYRNSGYRDARILSEDVVLSEDKKSIYITIEIDEGSLYYFGDITLEGNEIYETSLLEFQLSAAGISRGSAFKEEDFELGVDTRVRSMYLDNGYLYAQIIPELSPRNKDTLDVRINIVENDKVSIRHINLVGNTRTRDFVIRRELRIFPGDVFDREALIRSQSDIFRLNYFSDVVPDIVPVDDSHIDLEISLVERSSDRANVAMGYSELDGIIGSMGVDIANFRGMGQRVSTEYRRGQSYEYMSLGFTEPWLLGKPNLLGINLYYSTRGTSVNYYQPYDLGVKGISLRFGRRFRWPDSYFRGSWSLSFSEKSYTNIDTDEDGNYVDVFYYQNPQGFLITQGNSFTQIISRDNRNRPEFPTMGSSVSLSTKYSGGILGGQEDFIKNKFSLEWWTPILPKLVVYQNFQSGLINVFSDNSVVPYDERFYMGGAGLISYTTSLRGYPDQSVGPWRSGYPLGGKGILKYSMELRYLITDNPTLYGFVFAESGQVWDDFNQININKMARSAGSGVRVFMPMIGLLGFDIGYGFDDINGDDKADGWETHFVFGMPF